jgi:hypothetical protein
MHKVAAIIDNIGKNLLKRVYPIISLYKVNKDDVIIMNN